MLKLGERVRREIPRGHRLAQVVDKVAFIKLVRTVQVSEDNAQSTNEKQQSCTLEAHLRTSPASDIRRTCVDHASRTERWCILITCAPPRITCCLDLQAASIIFTVTRRNPGCGVPHQVKSKRFVECVLCTKSLVAELHWPHESCAGEAVAECGASTQAVRVVAVCGRCHTQ